MVLFLDLFSGTSSVFSARTRSTNQIPLVTRPRWLGELRFDVAVTFHADGRHQKTGMGSKATSSSRAVTKHVLHGCWMGVDSASLGSLKKFAKLKKKQPKNRQQARIMFGPPLPKVNQKMQITWAHRLVVCNANVDHLDKPRNFISFFTTCGSNSSVLGSGFKLSHEFGPQATFEVLMGKIPTKLRHIGISKEKTWTHHFFGRFELAVHES